MISRLKKIPGYGFWVPLLLWVAWFSLWRLIFIAVYFSGLEGSFWHKLAAWPAGFRLDISTACYIHFPWLFLFLVYQWWNRRFLLHIFIYLLVPLSVIVTVLLIGNTGLYATWQTPINNRMLLYFQYPSEVLHFLPLWEVILFPVVTAVICWFFVRYMYRFYAMVKPVPTLWQKSFITLLTPAFFLLFVRGGWQQMPVNESASCYSVYTHNNHAAMNPVFYFAHSSLQWFTQSNRYTFYSRPEAEKYNAQLFESTEAIPADSVFTTRQPNVVIIILESWVAEILNHPVHGQRITPFTDSLIKNSIWFSQAYGPGYRTDQGLVSVISGYPAQPDNSIIAFPSKTESLPSIVRHLGNGNYASSFFYGGELEFANMKNYLIQAGFHHFEDKHAFPRSKRNSKWGAHDEFVLMNQIRYLRKERQPFLSCVLTLSTHEPFEVPVVSPFTGSSVEEKFMHTAWYTDLSLKKYFAAARQQEWYKNTLFVLVADHGHHLPFDLDMNDPASRRVTLILHGPVIKPAWKGRELAYTVSQQDIPATLAWLTDKNHKNPFAYSRNLFGSGRHWAFYSNENVLSFIEGDSVYRYFFGIGRSMGDLAREKEAKSYLQVFYKDFLDR